MSAEPELRERLEQLHRELERTGSVDGGSRALLREILDDIRDLLERSEASRHTHLSLVERLGEAAREFEESHPRLAATVGRVADALANLGI